MVILAEQEQAPFFKCGAIPLQIMLRLLTMFAPNFFELSHCWVSNKDDSSIGKNFPIVISKYLLE
jgi:type IV secretory pathway VirB3-like protein